MIRDLRSILEDWEYEPGKISVRKILGRRGQEKLQTRVDLGVLQLELDGRPDGLRPRGHDSLLEYHEQRLAAHLDREGNDEDFILTPEMCRELRHEAYLFYQRYLSLFVLEEYVSVIRDTARNLRMMDFCRRYAAAEADRHALEPQRPYVLMMYTRSRARLAMSEGDSPRALRVVNGGLHRVQALIDALDDETPQGARTEIELLIKLADEILDELPDDAEAKLEARLEAAIEDERFEDAAELRDQLEHARNRPTPPLLLAEPPDGD